MLLVRVQPVMKCPETVQLSREDGEALRTRVAGDGLTADDRRVLDHALEWDFWLFFSWEGAPAQANRAVAPQGRPAHGRRGAQAYSGAQPVECRHETLAAGERCPVCGRGRLYRVAPGMDIRLDGHALLSAVRYVLEKFRCS